MFVHVPIENDEISDFDEIVGDTIAFPPTKLVRINPNKNQFGFNLVSEGMDNFTAKINIEVQWASEQWVENIMI